MSSRAIPISSGRIRYIGFGGVLGGGVLIALLLAIYWPGLHGGFFFDDEANILLAEGVKMDDLSFASIRSAMLGGHAGLFGRSVAQFSFGLNYYFSGFDPFAFKVTNLVIHAVNAILVFLLALRLLSSSCPSSSRYRAPAVAAIVASIWLLHPVQLTSVLLVVQRMTTLSAFFLLSALLLHMRGREQAGFFVLAHLFVAWGICWPLSVLSKETGILFPFFVLAGELIIRSRYLGRFDKFSLVLGALLSLAVMSGIAYAFSAYGHWLWVGYDNRGFSLGERILTEGRVLWFYLGLFVFPRLEALGLHHDDLLISSTLFSPWTTLPALVGLVGLVFLVWRIRIAAPLIAFGVIWFLIGHGLESTVLPLEIAHEHRNYLPLFGILLAGGVALSTLYERPGWRRTLCMAITALALIYFSMVTYLRSQQFGEDIRRTQIEAQHHRGSARAQYDAGQVLSQVATTTQNSSPVHGLARRHFELAMELDPALKIGGLGLIYMDCMVGGVPGRHLIDELTLRLRTTPFAPGDSAFFYGLKEMLLKGTICLDRPDVDALFEAGIQNPRLTPWIRAKFYSWYADYLWLHEHDLPAARVALRQSITLVPSSPSNQLKWAQLTLLDGNSAKARQLLEALGSEQLSLEEKKTLNDLLSGLAEENP